MAPARGRTQPPIPGYFSVGPVFSVNGLCFTSLICRAILPFYEGISGTSNNGGYHDQRIFAAGFFEGYRVACRSRRGHALGRASGLRDGDAPAREFRACGMPTIRLGRVEVSRLILGSNPFFGYAHMDGDIGRQMQEYYTEGRIMQVLDEAAALGVTAVTAPPSPEWIRVFSKYRDQGGKLSTWIAQPHGSPKKMKEEIDLCAKAGAKAAFIQGHRVEEQVDQKTFEVVRGWLEHIKSHGLAAGMAAHRPDIHPLAEKLGFPTDFYFQCFFRPDKHPENYALECRDHAVETIRSIGKPVVAYKILGAARLPPEEGFAYAFRNIAAKDGVCVGIYNKNKPGMLADDVALDAAVDAIVTECRLFAPRSSSPHPDPEYRVPRLSRVRARGEMQTTWPIPPKPATQVWPSLDTIWPGRKPFAWAW